jgi:D-aminoacyl-tRNA deacylase
MDRGYVVVASATDPVDEAVRSRWGTPEATGWFVDGVPIRRLGDGAYLLVRPGPHVHDERLDARLPAALLATTPTLVFPSIHRSERNVECLTVHPLGNLGTDAEVGGEPRTVSPTDPRRMAHTLRRLDERSAASGLPVTFEATHHGPSLRLPAFFVEIGYGNSATPPDPAVKALAEVVPEIATDPSDRIALAVGGGHYAPHFTDLTLRRRWAFGHIVSRHALERLDRATARAAWDATRGAEGIVFARADDQNHPALEGLASRLRDRDAPALGEGTPTASSRSASGT